MFRQSNIYQKPNQSVIISTLKNFFLGVGGSALKKLRKLNPFKSLCKKAKFKHSNFMVLQLKKYPAELKFIQWDKD